MVLRSRIVDEVLLKRTLALGIHLLFVPEDAVVMAIPHDKVVFSVAIEVSHDNRYTGVRSQVKIGVEGPFVVSFVFDPAVGNDQIASAIPVDVAESEAVAFIIAHFISHKLAGSLQLKIV